MNETTREPVKDGVRVYGEEKVTKTQIGGEEGKREV